MEIENTYKKWLSDADENTVSILKNMSEEEKKDSFYKCIEFGTGKVYRVERRGGSSGVS